MNTTRNQDRMAPLAPADDTCRTCGRTVSVTLDADGRPEQLDGSGNLICDTCWDADQN